MCRQDRDVTVSDVKGDMQRSMSSKGHFSLIIHISVFTMPELFAHIHVQLILILLSFTVKEFDAAKYFGTHPSLVNRRFNRPSLENLKKLELRGNLNEADLKVSELTLILELKREFITFSHLPIKTKSNTFTIE